MKKLRNIVILIALTFYLVTVSGFISTREHELKIGSVEVRITDSTSNQFIRSSDVHNMLGRNKYFTFGQPFSEVDLNTIEQSLKKNQIIDKAEVFVTEPGVLHVEISQKTPFVRIFNRYGQGYYLDQSGNVIPAAGNFSPYVLVANGYIAEPFTVGKTLNIYDVKHDSIKRSLYTIYEVHKLASFITSDAFWSAQIEQIYVNNRYEFELIPRVGSHIIELGRAENLEEKFANLKILYQQGFNNLGWNQYEKISLKYKNQVVCTKIQ